MAVIGIDLGTTNSLAGVWQDGKVVLIPNAFGEYLTPSVVGIGKNQEVFVGSVAKEMLATQPYDTFREFKRNMGTNFLYGNGRKKYRAEELSAFVLRRLKEDAEKFLGEEVTEAVISVPAYFDDNKRNATKNAGRLAGLKVERLINEPSAVALKHHTAEKGAESFIVFDFGGGTLDVSLVEAFDNVVEIQAVAGDNYLGGKDFNEIIAQDFYEQNQISEAYLTKNEQENVLKEAEAVKKELTDKNEAERQVYIKGEAYTLKMTNQRLIHLSAELFSRMAKPIAKVINMVGIELEELDKVILVGGSSKMPVVQQYIKGLLGDKVPVVLEENPDESVAYGVGMAAAIKERTGDIKDMLLTDICPFSLGTELYDGSFSPVIEKNETLPCKRTMYYTTVRNNQITMNFPIYQGENIKASDNLKIGEINLKRLPKAPEGERVVKVTFIYDINGILDVNIESSVEKVHKVIVNKQIGLSEKELEKRVEQLEKMPLHPWEKEENRLLFEKAERLYEQTTPKNRQVIQECLRYFKELLINTKGRKVRQEYVRIMAILDYIEQNQVDFGPYDETFWQKEEEDTDE